MEQIPARSAATIVLIREGNAVLEILMLRRAARAPSASGAHVFPGGGLAEVDHEVVERGLIHGQDRRGASHRLGSDEALTYYAAALRELFEESGLLLARRSDGASLDATTGQLARWRGQLERGEVRWDEMLASHGLVLDLGRMEYLAHWVTPAGLAHRFDTRFFIAPAPRGQEARADGREIDEVVWIGAARAVENAERGDWVLLAPTLRTLQGLVTVSGVEEALAAAARSTVRRIQPRHVEREGQRVLAFPGDPDYVEG